MSTAGDSDYHSKYKNTSKHEDARRRRNEASVELRKARKDDQLSKRRNLDSFMDKEIESPPVSSESLDELFAQMNSNEMVNVFNAVVACRRMLSQNKDPPIDVMISKGIVPKSIQFLRMSGFPDLQFEAAWILTNIASGTTQQTMVLVDNGAIPELILLLGSKSIKVLEQSIWALGNVAGDGAEFRDMILSYGIVNILVEIVKTNVPVTLMRQIMWTMSNLCRHKNPPAKFELLKPILPVVKQGLFMNDREIVCDACWTLSYLTDGDNEKIQACIDSGLVPLAIGLLSDENSNTITPALRAIGNIVTGSDAQTEVVIQCGVLPLLGNLLEHSRPMIVKEAAWAISNITAGTVDQIQQVIDADLLPLLIKVVEGNDVKSQKEAIWALTNLTSGGSIEQFQVLVQHHGLQALCSQLTVRDLTCITNILDSLANILEAAKKVNALDDIALLIEDCGGLDKIEMLQNHENELVYQKASSLIDSYFTEEPADTKQEIVNNQYTFEAPTAVPHDKFNF